MRIRPTADGFRVEADQEIRKSLLGLNPTVRVGADTKTAKLAVTDLRTYINTLASKIQNFRLGVDDKAMQAQLAKDYALLLALDKRTFSPRLNIEGVASMQAALLGIDAQLDRMHAKLLAEAAATDGATAATNRLLGRWGALSAKVAIFGGVAAVSGWHIAIDASIEALAVLIPAIVTATAGLAAFGAAGFDAGKQIYTQMKNVHTVFDATGVAVKPMTGNIERLHQVVQGQVWSIFGNALGIAAHNAGLFNKLAVGTGVELDRLVSYATILAEKAGPGIQTFLHAGERDLALFGDILHNIGVALFSLIKVTQETHVAEFLLEGIDAASKLLVLITKLPTPLLALVIALHAVYLWGGLAVSGVAGLVGVFSRLALTVGGVKAAEVATAEFAKTAGPMALLSARVTDLKTGLSALPSVAARVGPALLALATNPFTWVVVAAVGLGVLVYWLHGARDATTKWADSLQNLIDVQRTFTGVQNATAGAIGKIDVAMAGATRTLKNFQSGSTTFGASQQAISQAAAQQAKNVSDLRGEHTKYTNELALETFRVQQLTGRFGNVHTALGLMSQAHIKATDIAHASQRAWAADVQTLVGLQAGLRAVASSAGNTNANVAVLNHNMNDQMTAVQQLNQAWDTFIGTLTSSEQSFDAYRQGLGALNTSAQKFTFRLGEFKIGGNVGKAAIDGLSNASAALNTSFSQQIVNTNALIDTWRTGQVPINLFNRGVKDSIAPLVKYAAGSKEATAQLIGLAREANYRGPESLKALVKWLGNTHNALGIVKGITDQTTVSFSKMGREITSDLDKAFEQEIIKSSGAKGAIKALADAVVNHGVKSDQFRSARERLINDLEKSGLSAKQATSYVDGLQRKINAMHGKNVDIGAHAHADGSVSFSESQKVEGGKGHGVLFFRAHGGMIHGVGTGTSDSNLARVSKGEFIVNAASTSRHRGLLESINARKYASGGFVGTEDQIAKIGPFVSGAEASFTKSVVSSYVRAAMSASASALRQAVSISAAAGVPGNVQSYRGLVTAVLKRLEGFVFAPGDVNIALSQMATESGGNPRAVNLSDSNAAAGHPSVGLMQVIAGTFDHYSGPYRNTGPFAYGVSENPTANIYAGLNYAIARYGWPGWKSVLGHGHGYDNGGWLMPGVTMAVNKTGQPEWVSPPSARAHKRAGSTPQKVTLEIRSSGHTEFDNFMTTWMKKSVFYKGNGNVQSAFGTQR